MYKVSRLSYYLHTFMIIILVGHKIKYIFTVYSRNCFVCRAILLKAIIPESGLKLIEEQLRQ